MPELPEVETICAGLAKRLTFAQIARANVIHPRTFRHNASAAVIEQALSGKTITATKRRGKFMWLCLADARHTGGDVGNPAMIIHLGMSGQMLVTDAAGMLAEDRRKHLRASFTTTGNTTAWFVDQRTFGYWCIDPLANDPHGRLGTVPLRIAHIAPDILEARHELDAVARVIKKRHSTIKSVLLDQTVVSGIGNIYADEMLWAARIHPQTTASHMSTAALTNLLSHGVDVVEAAVAQGGTSFDDLYVNVNGQSGYFSVSLKAYAHEAKPCARCETPMVRSMVGGRSNHFCPHCQRRY